MSLEEMFLLVKLWTSIQQHQLLGVMPLRGVVEILMMVVVVVMVFFLMADGL